MQLAFKLRFSDSTTLLVAILDDGVLLILKVGTILDAGFNHVYVFLTDEVRSSGEIIDTWVYTQGIGKSNYALATAVGLMKSVLSTVLVLGTNALSRKWEASIW